MVLRDDDRKMRLGMLVETFRHQHMGADIDRAAPEFGQKLALDAHMADIFGVGNRLYRGDLLVERQLDHPALGRIDMDLHRLRIEVAGCDVPMLPLAAVRRQLDGDAVGAVKSFVTVQQALDVIIAGRQLGDVVDRPADRLAVDDRRLARRQMIDGDAEHDLRTGLQIDLVARLVGRIGRQHHQHASVLRLGAALGRKGQVEFEGRRLGRFSRKGCGTHHRRTDQ